MNRLPTGLRCLVTGGAGFVGRHIADYLATLGAVVTTFDLKTLDIIWPGSHHHVTGDIRDERTVMLLCEEADLVFHLSGLLGTHELFENPAEAVDVNIKGALNVLNAARVSRSSPRVFLPAKPNEWNNIYSVTSQAVEKLGHAYREAYSQDVRILRIKNVYGPGQAVEPVRKFVPYAICRALRNERIEIFGDGTQEVELLYATDLARLATLYMSLDGGPDQTMEAISATKVSVQVLAETIVNLTDSHSELVHVGMRLGERPHTIFSPAPIFTDGVPLKSLEEGLQLTIESYREDRRNLWNRRKPITA